MREYNFETKLGRLIGTLLSLDESVHSEEREQTVMLVIDVSASESFNNSSNKTRSITEVAAVLAFAITNNDKVGNLLFDQVEKFIPPRKGNYPSIFVIY